MHEESLAPYDLSAGMPPFQLCPACGTAWAPTVWLVVDAVHRPELVSAIRDGTLCAFHCTSCGKTINVNTPFLVLRDRAPRLIFSPSPGTASLDDHNQLVHALATLKEALAGLWHDGILDEIRVVARPLAAAELGTGAATADDLLEALAHADTGWKQQYLLAGCPALYGPEIEALLQQRIDQAWNAHDATEVYLLRTRLGLLSSCRQAGSVAVKALLPPFSVYAPDSELNAHLLVTGRVLRSGNLDVATVALMDATEGLAKTGNALLWAELQLTLASLDQAADSPGTLIAQEACEEVANSNFICGPWLTMSTFARLQLAAACMAGSQSAADEETAARLYEAAAEAFQALGDGRQQLIVYDALGFLYGQCQHGDRAENLEAALKCFGAGAELADRELEPGNWAAMQFNLGNAFLERLNGDTLENIQHAIVHLGQAAAVQKKLAAGERFRETTDRLNAAYQLRLAQSLARDPRSPDLQCALAALQNHDWDKALAAYHAAIAKTEEMLAAAYVEEKRREIFNDFGTAYSAAAYICFRLGRFGEGVSLLEAGRCRLLSDEVEAFDVVDADLPATLREELGEARRSLRIVQTTKVVSKPDRESEVSSVVGNMNRNAWTEWQRVRQKIQEVAPDAIHREIGEADLLRLAPEDGALIIPVFSVVGCGVLVVPDGRSAISVDDVLWIDDFTDNDLIALLIAWSDALKKSNRSQRRLAVQAVCERLSHLFTRHVIERLETLNLARGAPVTILPQGGLGMLPVHAAATDLTSAGDLLDKYVVRYAPSAYLLSVMNRRASSLAAETDGLLGVVDPLGDLDYGRVEGAVIADLLPAGRVTLLEGSAANGNNVKTEASGKAYVHLSCHAYYTTAGGQYAGLYLAHDDATKSNEEFLAAFEGRPPLDAFFLAGRRWIVLSLDLKRCRLVTLSACESGRTDVVQPDEFLGLPAAFLKAGAAAVISTLWRVDDLATMLLSRRLYEHLINDRMNPSCALREAQLWLRNASNRTLYGFCSALREKGAWQPSEQLERQLRRFALGTPDDQPYSDPYYWAAFVIYGSS